ncbi:MAG: L,D-transpeptidase family protein [Planctomycetota bacterium]
MVNRRTRNLILFIAVGTDVLVLAGLAAWFFGRRQAQADTGVTQSSVLQPLDAQPAAPAAADPAPPPPRHDTAAPPTSTPATGPAEGRASDDSIRARELAGARKLIDDGKLLEARDRLDALFKRDLADSDAEAVRVLLARVADETVFSRKAGQSDPLLDTYEVQSGDRLTEIAREREVPWEAVALLSGVSNPSNLRAGQKLRIPKGTFHVKLYKSKFRLDIYLNDLYLRSYRVGLGADDGTPEGIWRVKNRLTNPRYFPSASATDKRIIEPDDPNNPLGEYWIGLEGLEGNAVGQEGYGIHGTIDPDSIGKNFSLGCIRMLNEEVAVLYKLVQPGRSLVTVFP